MTHSDNPAFQPAHETHHSGVYYVFIWVCLLILTGATYTFFRIDLGAWALPVALAIAITKALLVILFFMHLYDQRGAFRIVLFVSFIFVLLFMGLTVGDIATRYPYTNPPSGQGRQTPKTGAIHFPDPGGESQPANLGNEGKKEVGGK